MQSMSDFTVVTKANVSFKENWRIASIGFHYKSLSASKWTHKAIKKIRKNYFILLGDKDAKAKTKPKDQIDPVMYTKLRADVAYRKEKAIELFKGEILNIVQSISLDEDLIQNQIY